jgi:hypothetical protein
MKTFFEELAVLEDDAVSGSGRYQSELMPIRYTVD